MYTKIDLIDLYNDNHRRICVVCGKEFEITQSNITKQTCFRKCANELISGITSEKSDLQCALW